VAIDETTLRHVIQCQIPAIKEDLVCEVQYIVASGRGKCLALEMVCFSMGLLDLEKELEALREQSYDDERRRHLEDFKKEHT
jgi:hypothetical protein